MRKDKPPTGGAVVRYFVRASHVPISFAYCISFTDFGQGARGAQLQPTWPRRCLPQHEPSRWHRRRRWRWRWWGSGHPTGDRARGDVAEREPPQADAGGK